MATHQQMQDVLRRAIEVKQLWTDKSIRLIDEAVKDFEMAESLDEGSARDLYKRSSDRLLEASEAARQGAVLAEKVVAETTVLLGNG